MGNEATIWVSEVAQAKWAWEVKKKGYCRITSSNITISMFGYITWKVKWTLTMQN